MAVSPTDAAAACEAADADCAAAPGCVVEPPFEHAASAHGTASEAMRAGTKRVVVCMTWLFLETERGCSIALGWRFVIPSPYLLRRDAYGRSNLPSVIAAIAWSSLLTYSPQPWL